MLKAAMAEGSMEGCLLDMPYEILLEIFGRLPLRKVIEISKLCSEFRDVAEDTRIWKYVYIKYDSATFAFEDLYSKPWPVKAIDLSCTKIKPPISPKIDQAVKVTKLNLSKLLEFEENKNTMNAILTKYQCKELNFDFNRVDLLEGIAPEAFSALEVLSLQWTQDFRVNERGEWILSPYHLWLGPILRNCQNLKSLNLSIQISNNFETMGFVKSLPKSLEKLWLNLRRSSENYFFELLAERIPNLKELGWCSTKVHPALLKFQYLEALCVYRYRIENTSDLGDLCKYLTKFSVLKTLYVDMFYEGVNFSNTTLAEFRTILELHGIIVRPFEEPNWTYSAIGGNLWEVSNKDV